jgi:hypothetical protein
VAKSTDGHHREHVKMNHNPPDCKNLLLGQAVLSQAEILPLKPLFRTSPFIKFGAAASTQIVSASLENTFVEVAPNYWCD